MGKPHNTVHRLKVFTTTTILAYSLIDHLYHLSLLDRRMTKMATAFNTQYRPPILRMASPGLTVNDHARQQVLRGNSNFHSTSLRNHALTNGVNGVNGVNKTALHPSGVQ